jgi:hypothetical protein
MERIGRGWMAFALAIAAATLAALWATAGVRAQQTATAASSISVKDEGYLRLVKSSGALLIDEGKAHGTIPGTVKIHFVYNGNPIVSAQITIYGRAGSIRAQASGRLSSPTSASPSFGGTLTIDGGSGRYAHARGAGHLYGVFYRRSYAMTVQTLGTLRY